MLLHFLHPLTLSLIAALHVLQGVDDLGDAAVDGPDAAAAEDAAAVDAGAAVFEGSRVDVVAVDDFFFCAFGVFGMVAVASPIRSAIGGFGVVGVVGGGDCCIEAVTAPVVVGSAD